MEMAGSSVASKNAPAQQVTPAPAPLSASAVLTFFTDRPTFEAAAPDLTKETFESGLVGPGGVVLCSDPVSAANSGGCFPAGTLQTGFSYASSSGNGVVILGAGVVGQPSTAIAANFFADSNIINFSDPDVFAVGFDAFGFGGPFTVSVFSANGLEGQTAVSPGGFFGVISDEPITSVNINSGGGGEVVDNLCYGSVDADGDGVPNTADLCPETSIPEAGVPSVRLGTNRWALVDGDFDFDTTSPNGNGPGRSYTTTDTGGCSCEQIIDELGLGKGHAKFGCSISAMDDWVAIVSGGAKRGSGALVAAALPEGFDLSEAYPNPFNPQAQFTLQVAQDQHVGIHVYDVLGRQVAALHDDVLTEGQSYTFTFEASNLPSGTYLIRTVGETFQATRRVVLLK